MVGLGFLHDPMKLEIQSQDYTEVYASEIGFCCINQLSPTGESALVLISPQCIDQICSLLQTAKGEAIRNRIEYLKTEGDE